MAVIVRISGHWRYRGSVKRSGRTTICKDMDHARNLCRKVIREARANAKYDRGRNSGFIADYITVRTEDSKVGDEVHVWSSTRSWHKGVVYERPQYMAPPVLRVKSLEEE